MSIKTVGVLAGTLWGITLCHGAAASTKVSGSIVGMVSDPSGMPQMGATVSLFNRFDRLLQRSLTSEKGTFGFDALPPGVYTVQVSLASYLPALKRNIVVQPGMQSLLNVSLATVFSSIQLVAVSPSESSLMSDEWKWVLRSSASTRPVLRLLPEYDRRTREQSSKGLFSSTSGVVKVSGGDSGSILNNEPDLGTAFALATSFLGENQLRFSGNFGYSAVSGLPTAAFRTSFRPELAGGDAPEVKLTMRQLSMPVRAGVAVLSGMPDSAPVLRTLSASFADQTRLTEAVRFEYGATLDSVSFLQHLNYVSPYGRITYDNGSGEVIQVSYASGAPPTDLLTQGVEGRREFQQDLNGLAAFPRVSLRDGRARVQRNQSWEVAYSRTIGSRTIGAAFYDETVSNAAVIMVGPVGFQGPDLLPDVFSNSWIVNVGDYGGMGYAVSFTQKLGEHLDGTVTFGSASVLTANGVPETGSPDELRAKIRASRRHSLTMRLAGALPKTGTQFSTSYQWADLAALTPQRVYLTQAVRENMGLNIQLRQPIPHFGGLPGRLEATADLRNLLEQGYVPLTVTGRRSYLMHTPRSLRGGLSFIF
ncbi:MAG TPA: carboxypeptidase-like regulatory domain-containing protein [Bryobacteraceae bacterium]|nr:carboxypeptidase-like regulatory domain-containing protein [Bryobacteraceae bacterium]HPU70731.1 carboxypeptidase-like regulatory domain-containing protein [Bryobacteraceae bacterium]